MAFKFLHPAPHHSSVLWRCSQTLRNLGLDILHHLQQVLYHLISLLASRPFDRLHLLLGILGRILFSFLIPARMLIPTAEIRRRRISPLLMISIFGMNGCLKGAGEGREKLWGGRGLLPPSRTCGTHHLSAFGIRQSPFGLRCERLSRAWFCLWEFPMD